MSSVRPASGRPGRRSPPTRQRTHTSSSAHAVSGSYPCDRWNSAGDERFTRLCVLCTMRCVDLTDVCWRQASPRRRLCDDSRREVADENSERARGGVSDREFRVGDPGGSGPPRQPARRRQGAGGRQGGGRAGGSRRGAPIGGTLTPAKPDARGWGWQVKASINPATPRPFYNKAKELLFQDKQITSYTISTYNPESLLRGRASTTTTSGSRCSTARCRTTRCAG